MNERNTEAIVREHFRNDPFFSSIKFEEQKSSNARIAERLSYATKSVGSSGKAPGKPEFIITFPTQNSDYLIVVECKADVNKHESPNRDKPKDYAVDGAIHYSRYLAEEFDVVSLAISGEVMDEMLVSSFIQRKGKNEPDELSDKELLSIYDYVKLFKNEQFNHNIKDSNIIENAIELNELFHKASVSESMRNTFVSAILLGLEDDIFRGSYQKAKSTKDLAELLLHAVDRVLTGANVRKQSDMMSVYSKISDEPLVKQRFIKIGKKQKDSKEFFEDIVHRLHKNVYPLTQYEDEGYDILGRFYTEFVRYAASKQKQGLVLTPPHVTDLFCDLVSISPKDVVYDPCCGTGGFLISAMKKMINLAGNNNDLKNNIRTNQLVGVELRPEMFTFACSNMMLRGDGKSNIDCGNCFDDVTKTRVNLFRPTVSFLNPPYDQGTAAQLQFIGCALDAVKNQSGRVAAIVQMSCGLKNDGDTKAERRRLLERYHLEAVISMPNQLFYPIGVVTCIMVFDSSIPNKGHKTWFGYLKDDGLILRKNKGRIDRFSRWEGIKTRFLEAYQNKDEIPGLSVKREVRFDEEWCAEAYMKTDYSNLKESDFKKNIQNYVAFNVRKGYIEFQGEDDSE